MRPYKPIAAHQAFSAQALKCRLEWILNINLADLEFSVAAGQLHNYLSYDNKQQ